MGTGGTKMKSQTKPSIEIKDINIPAGNVDMNEIPNDQYLCPKCGRVPEILNIHSENGHIELKCKNHGIIELTIKEYYLTMRDNIFNYFKKRCFNCQQEQRNKENMFKYCNYCKVDFCKNCLNCFNQRERDHRHNHLDVCIPVNEKNHKCLEHFNSEIKSFCLDCEENVCEKDSTTKHLKHKKINFINFENDINKYINIIKEKNKMLADIIRFNQIILNSYYNFQNNYFHIKSLINVGKSYEEENKGNSKKLESQFCDLEKNYKIQKDSNKLSKKEFMLDFTGNEVKLLLRKKGF